MPPRDRQSLPYRAMRNIFSKVLGNDNRRSFREGLDRYSNNNPDDKPRLSDFFNLLQLTYFGNSIAENHRHLTGALLAEQRTQTDILRDIRDLLEAQAGGELADEYADEEHEEYDDDDEYSDDDEHDDDGYSDDDDEHDDEYSDDDDEHDDEHDDEYSDDDDEHDDEHDDEDSAREPARVIKRRRKPVRLAEPPQEPAAPQTSPAPAEGQEQAQEGTVEVLLPEEPAEGTVAAEEQPPAVHFSHPVPDQEAS